jgi:hypothetical protein
VSWLAWGGVIYAAGSGGTAIFNAGSLILSGGIITRPSAIVRNAVLWPIMLPYLIVDWTKNS